jgi:peptide/nickel transport system permease protein
VDPANTFVPGYRDLPPEVQAQIRHEVGLSGSFVSRYLHWVRGVAEGGGGRSLADGRTVGEKIESRLFPTVALVLASIVLSLLVGVVLGVFAGYYRENRVLELLVRLTYAFSSIPGFILGLFAILVFSKLLPLFPYIGRFSDRYVEFNNAGLLGLFLHPAALLDFLAHLALPAAVLAVADGNVGTVVRHVRNDVAAERDGDFVLLARSAGIPERKILFKYLFRSSLILLAEIVGNKLPYIFSGAVVVEMIFSWGGMGQMLVRAIFENDYPVVMAVILGITVLAVVGNLLADLFILFADPRLRREAAGP